MCVGVTVLDRGVREGLTDKCPEPRCSGGEGAVWYQRKSQCKGPVAAACLRDSGAAKRSVSRERMHKCGEWGWARQLLGL